MSAATVRDEILARMAAPSIREQILTYIETTVLPGTVQVGGRIYRSRAQAYGRSEAPAISISPGEDNPANAPRSTGASLGRLDQVLPVLIEIYVRGNVPDQLADPIGVDVHARMMADRTLGGLAHDVQPDGWRPEYEQADATAGWIGHKFLIRYRTRDDAINATP
jgi:hypothetical protein